MSLQTIDAKFISFCQKISVPLARFGLFIVFFWFGILKVVGQSPASGLVERLFNETIPFMDFGTFLIAFGIFECIIGILFLIRGADRLTILLLFIHMATTTGPLVLLPEETWSGFLVPTLEGQYIIKNILVIAAGITVAAHMHPLRPKE